MAHSKTSLSKKRIVNHTLNQRKTDMKLPTAPFASIDLTKFVMVAAVLGIFGFTAGVTEAALITPTGATASSDFGADFDAGNLIDNSGLSGTDPHTIADTHSGITGLTWLSSGAALPQTVTFDLGSSYLLTDMHIWQYSHGGANWSTDVTVQFSTTGTGGAFGSDMAVVLADGAGIVPAQNFAIPSITANAVKFTITSRSGAGLAHTGLGEVKFSGTAAVPTPAALPAGLALIGFVAARRQRNI